MCVQTFSSNTAEIVSVQDHTDHSVLELLGDDVVENDI